MANTRSSRALELLPYALVFESVARHRSFRAAANELGLGRSTVSERVAALERALGARLLRRTTRHMSLTEAGKVLRDEMVAITDRWRAAESLVERFASHPTGSLTVTAPDLLMRMIVAPAVKRYRDRFPDVHVRMRVSVETEPLPEKGIDIGLRAGPLPDSGLGSQTVWRGPHIALTCPTRLPLLDLDDPSKLGNVTWVDFAGRRPLGQWINDKTGQRMEMRPRPAVVADGLSAFVELLTLGVGVGLLAEVIAAPLVRAGKLVRVLPDWSADEVSFHLVTPSPRPSSVAIREFLAELETAFDKYSRGLRLDTDAA